MLVTPQLLSSFPSLKSLPQDMLAELARHSTVQKFARRGVVLTAGVREDHICLLFEGRLQGVDFTIDGREVGLYFVEPGDFCGELALFDDGPQPEFVIALTTAVTVFVPIEQLRQVSFEHAALLSQFGQRLAGRVREMTRQRSLLGLPNTSQRVCCQLWMLVPEQDKAGEGAETAQAKTAQAKAAQVSVILNPPTHMEIAIMLSLSRETVSRVFQTLQMRNIVKRDGTARLLITDLESLRRLAEGEEEL